MGSDDGSVLRVLVGISQGGTQAERVQIVNSLSWSQVQSVTGSGVSKPAVACSPERAAIITRRIHRSLTDSDSAMRVAGIAAVVPCCAGMSRRSARSCTTRTKMCG